jgi:hypothetical protein
MGSTVRLNTVAMQADKMAKLRKPHSKAQGVMA